MQIILGKIEKPEFYIDKAFARAKKKINLVKIGDRSKTQGQKYKHLEAIRLNVIRDALVNDMQKIRHAFPMYDELNKFYQKMFECFIDSNQYKKSLAAILWAENKISHIFTIQNKRMKNKEETNEIMSIRNVFMARVNSVLKQISENLYFLDKARKKLKEMPNFKPNMYTVAIAGFPNVGKSTLLSKMTDSKPEINSYAFTTKGLMIGFLLDDRKDENVDVKNDIEEYDETKNKKKRKVKKKIQIVDTPGTLNRDKKVNKIEHMAELVLNYLSDKVIYVFDLTEISYPIKDQIELYRKLIKKEKEVIVYFSKSDILDKEVIEKFELDNEIAGYTNIDDIKKEILSNYVDKKEILNVASSDNQELMK